MFISLDMFTSSNLLEFWIQYITGICRELKLCCVYAMAQYQSNYINPGYGLSLVDTLWNAGSYRQPLEQEGNPMT